MPSFLTILFVQGVVRVVLAAIGIGVVSFIGAQALLDAAQSQIESNFDGLPADAVSLLALGQVDVAISVIFSAYSMRLALYSLKRMRIL